MDHLFGKSQVKLRLEIISMLAKSTAEPKQLEMILFIAYTFYISFAHSTFSIRSQ